jgi:hypothetical protein
MKEVRVRNKLAQRLENWISSKHGDVTQELLNHHVTNAITNMISDWRRGEYFEPVYVSNCLSMEELYEFETERAIMRYLDKQEAMK